MRISDLDFKVSQSLIPKYPESERDNSRLMVVDRKKGTIEHKVFKDFVSYLEEGDCVVANNSKVSPWFVYASKDKVEMQIEVTLMRELNADLHMWDAKVEPARKIRVGNKLYFGSGDLIAEVLDNTTSRGRTLKFAFQGTSEELKNVLEYIGYMPIPAELKRKPEDLDREYCSSVFATHSGGSVVPASGLHFSQSTLKRLEINDVDYTSLTLHIGLGVLEEIDVEDASKYKVDSECISVSNDASARINTALEKGKRVCAIGTSSLRAIEAAVNGFGKSCAMNGWINTFIHSNGQIKLSNMLLTNFYLPKTIPLVNAAAFMNSTELFVEAYQEAIKERYRFFIYGDAMLII